MLQTLLRIGQWQSQGKSEWDRFFDYPKAEREDKYGNPIKNYTLPIIFDLDAKEVIISEDNLREYDENKIKNSFPIKIKGGNNKAIYTSVPAKKINQIYKTFFGKEGTDNKNGELVESIEKINQNLFKQNLQDLLSQIFELKDKFLQLTAHSSKGEVDIRAINETFNFGKKENIVFVIVYIKAEEFGFNEPTLFAEIPDYRAFLNHSFFGDLNINSTKSTKRKLCYASGNIMEDVKALNLSERYSLNKMFVTETKNYASIFDKKKFSLNYQVSGENQKKLDYASDYLLHQGYKVKIAGIDHIIIPQFLSTSNVDLKLTLEGISRKSDLLFNLHKFDDVTKTIQGEVEDEIFWINFLAFESDGNYFKSTELIKDISNHQLTKIMKYLNDVDWQFKEAQFVDWNSAMMDFDYDLGSRVRRNFNFNSIYRLIPLRKDKEKKNKALDIFKMILENQNIHQDIIFDNFVELILCHYYPTRYKSYTNVHDYSQKGNIKTQNYFKWAVRDTVFKYLAFFQLLKKLKLIDMTEQNETTETSGNKYDKAETEFFNKMNLNQEQKAMFYLGRMLNSVEYIQKGKTKTVIQKVNFNGMDKEDIQRLRISLIEKAKQYNSIGKVLFTDNEFGKYFNFNDWKLSPQEAVFFLLTGYSFGVGVKDADQLTEKETQETI